MIILKEHNFDINYVPLRLSNDYSNNLLYLFSLKERHDKLVLETLIID